MTTDDLVPFPVDEKTPIAEIVFDDRVLELLPEQEWCELCAADEDAEPGMPRDITASSVEEDPTWDSLLGAGPVYEVLLLDCGHTVARLCGTAHTAA